MRRLLLAAALSAAALAAGCTSDVAPVDIGPPPAPTAADYELIVTASSSAVLTGEPVTFTVQLLDPTGADAAPASDIRSEVSPALGVLPDGDGVYRFTKIDTYTYFASVDVLDTTLVAGASVDVSAGPAAELEVRAEPPVVEAGSTVVLSAEVRDAWGNPTEGEVSWSVDPSASISGNEVVATALGSYAVTGSLASGASDSDSFVVEAAEPASLSISLSSYDVERGDGVIVTPVVLDQFGNPSDFPVQLSTDGTGTEVWADFVRFDDEGIFTVYADIVEYGLHDEDGPVLVDSTGPQIRVTTPQRGAEIPESDGPTVLVSGSVTDPWTGVTSVTINGDNATLLAGGLFEYWMTPEQGLNEIDVVAFDGDGNVSDHYQTFLWGDFLPPGDPSEDGILARLNEGAINVLEELIEEQVETGALTSALLGNVYTSPNYCLDLWVVELCGQFLLDIVAVDVGDLEMDLDPNNPTGGFPNGYLGFAMDLLQPSPGEPGLEITLEPQGVFSACVIILGCYSTTVSFDAVVGADEINLDTDVGLSVDTNNLIQVALANTSVSLAGMFVDLSDAGILGALIGDITTFLFDLFEPIFEALLPPIIEGVLPDVIEDALAGIEISEEIDILGALIEIAALPQQIDIDDDGMTIALETAAATTPAPGAPTTLGSWERPDSTLPSYGATPDFAISISDNFTNQLMHSVWQAGVIDFSMDSSELGLDLSDIGEFLPLTTISFETTPLLPPVVGPGSGGLLELALGDMLVNVYGDPGGNYGLMMQLAVTLWADADLDIDGDGLIQFNLDDPVIVMDFVTSDWTELDGEVVENLMDAVVDLLIPEVTSALDAVGGIPLPELSGFSLDSPSIYREPSPTYFITAEGSLVIVP